jgi:hypothetical protein
VGSAIAGFHLGTRLEKDVNTITIHDPRENDETPPSADGLFVDVASRLSSPDKEAPASRPIRSIRTRLLLRLRYVLYLSRHGVRSPTGKADQYNSLLHRALANLDRFHPAI